MDYITISDWKSYAGVTLNFAPVSRLINGLSLCTFSLSGTSPLPLLIVDLPCHNNTPRLSSFPSIQGRWRNLSLRPDRHLCILIGVFLCAIFIFLWNVHQIIWQITTVLELKVLSILLT